MKVRVGQGRFLPFLDHEQDTMLKRTGYNRGILQRKWTGRANSKK
jgi:hypothetical protein